MFLSGLKRRHYFSGLNNIILFLSLLKHGWHVDCYIKTSIITTLDVHLSKPDNFKSQPTR